MASTEHPRPAPAVLAQPPFAVSRRSLLAVGAVGVGSVALAACSQAKSPDSGGAAAGSTGTAAGTGTASGTAGAAPLAKLSSIKIGEAVSATGPDGSKIIISRPTATTVAAFSAICTHQGCTVAPAGKELDCPCHGSVYNVATGEVIQGPAPRALPKVNVTLSGDNVIPA